MRCLPYGPSAVLIEDLPVAPAALAKAVREHASECVIDVVPAARTVLITCADPTLLAATTARLDTLVRAAITDVQQPGRLIEIPVHYDGIDLDQVAEQAGLAVDDVIALHAGSVYQVAFCGFAPGFAYLQGLDRRLWSARRPTSRTRVPAGSVAIAAEYTAVYPTASPGGWHLLGTTDAVLFDPIRTPPALLEPGDHVRFLIR
jgi:KipI family sensor histidine kinase inhibitor